MTLSLVHVPHDDGDQSHDGLVETVEEVLERLALFPHAADDQTEAHGEHHQAQSVDPVHRSRHRYHLLSSDLLAAIEREYGLVHRHLHVDHFLGVLCLVLE